MASPVISKDVAQFVCASGRNYPAAVLDAARLCLVDWMGVAIGALNEAPGIALQKVMEGSTGRSVAINGAAADPRMAALLNGTLAHSLDFDDTHVGSLTHVSGPTWAAVLALLPEVENGHPLDAFVTGFEVGARLGRNFGAALLERGLHATGIVGCLAATAAGCALLRLDEHQTLHAFGLAATQAAGLTASFGTMAKPFHAGKAAMNAVLAVQLAQAGFTGATNVLDGPKGLAHALVQDGVARLSSIDDDKWEILHNTFKPYASCLLTHPSIDCARELYRTGGSLRPDRIRAQVHPFAIQLAGKVNPRTPLEGKFSVSFCIALALCGHRVSAADFSEERLNDRTISELAKRIEVVADSSLRETAARMNAETAGSNRAAEVSFALGNPENPMQWSDMQAKFVGLTEPHLGDDSKQLFEQLKAIDSHKLAAVLSRFSRLIAQRTLTTSKRI